MRRDVYRDGRIRAAIDEALSGLDARPTLQYRVMQEIRGEKKVKKKLSVGLVLALVLMMLTVAAVAAAALNSYFTGFAQLEQKYGEYEAWPEAAKVELVNLMAQSELAVDAAQVEKMNQLSGEEQLRLAESIIKEYYGSTYMSTTLVMERELGESMYWSYEMKALHDTLLKEYGYFKYGDWDECVLPEATDVSLEQATEIALGVMQEKFGLSKEYFAQRKLDACFVKTTEYPEPHWRLNWWEGGYCGVEVSRTGDPMSWTAPSSGITYTAETDLMAGARPATPLATDMQEDEALQKARAGLTEIGYYDENGNVTSLTEEQVEGFSATTQFFFHDDFNGGNSPVWMVTFYDGDKVAARVLYSYNGEYMDTAFGEQEFMRTNIPLDNFLDDTGLRETYPVGFPKDATAEEKARVAAEVKLLADAYLAEHPYWPNTQSDFYYATQVKAYGFPAADALSQDEAAAIAKEEAIRMGARAETVHLRSLIYSYLVDDPQRPVWQISVSRTNYWLFDYTTEQFEEEFGHHELDSDIFVVRMDAYTGEIVESFMVTDDTPHYVWRY